MAAVSVKRSIAEVKNFKDSSPYLIVVSETWLDDLIANSEICIPGYTIQRRDRGQNRRGGVVALFLLDGFKIFYSRRSDVENEYEAVWIQVQLQMNPLRCLTI